MMETKLDSRCHPKGPGLYLSMSSCPQHVGQCLTQGDSWASE